MTREFEKVFVYENRGSLSVERILQKGRRLQAHCDEYGYLQGGSLSISEPMSHSGAELQWIMDYCRSRGISKILVDSRRDIGKTNTEVQNTVNILCAHGLQIEVADSGLLFSPRNEAMERSENESMTMGA